MADIAPIAAAHAATPSQVVIAWTIRQPGITFALCGARNVSQARENAGAAEIDLSPDEITIISEAVTRQLVQLAA